MSDIVLRLRCMDTMTLVAFNVKNIDSDVVSFLDDYTTVKICLKPLEPIFVMKGIDSFDIWCLCNDTEKEEAMSKMKVLLKQEFEKIYAKYYNLQCNALSLLSGDNNLEQKNGVVVTCSDLISVLESLPNTSIRLQLGVEDYLKINGYNIKPGSLHLINIGAKEELNTSTLLDILTNRICLDLDFDVFYGESARFKAEIKNDVLILELV